MDCIGGQVRNQHQIRRNSRAMVSLHLLFLFVRPQERWEAYSHLDNVLFSPLMSQRPRRRLIIANPPNVRSDSVAGSGMRRTVAPESCALIEIVQGSPSCHSPLSEPVPSTRSPSSESPMPRLNSRALNVVVLVSLAYRMLAWPPEMCR